MIFQPHEKMCHFVFDGLIVPSMLVNGFNYHLLVSFDMEKNEIVNDIWPKPLKRVSSYVRNELFFSILDGEFKPYCLEDGALSFSFFLQFFSPL